MRKRFVAWCVIFVLIVYLGMFFFLQHTFSFHSPQQAAEAISGNFFVHLEGSGSVTGHDIVEDIIQSRSTVNAFLCSGVLCTAEKCSELGGDYFEGFFGFDRRCTNGETQTLGDVQLGPGGWEPPIGIPDPRDQGNDFLRAAPTYDSSNPLHYYVNGPSGCNDGNNGGRGSPAAPRCTIPGTLAAGSYVEVHGGPYSYSSGPKNWAGTAAQPIFIHGVGMPRILQSDFSIYSDTGGAGGTYLFVEGLSMFSLAVDRPSHHVTIRNMDFYGDPVCVPQNNRDCGGISTGEDQTTPVHDVVFYNITVHDNGVWDPQQAGGDRDIHGIKVGGYSYNVWILDSESYHNEGDGIQVSNQQIGPANTHHIYIGRNHLHHNKQTGVALKDSSHVIISENLAHDHRRSSSTPNGACMGMQYTVNNIWWIDNVLHDCDNGFFVGSSDPADDNLLYDHFYVGNKIYNIHSTLYDSEDVWSNGKAFLMWGHGLKTLVNNVVYDVDGGVSLPDYGATSTLNMSNTIFSNVNNGNAASSHIFIEGNEVVNSDIRNLLFDVPARIRWGDPNPANRKNVAQMQAIGECAGCIEANPQFVNAAGNDLHVNSGSPAIDNGAADAVYDLFEQRYGLNIRADIDHVSRPQESVWDIGAYEYLNGATTGMGWTPPIGIPMPPINPEIQTPTYDQANPLHYYVNGPSGCNDGNNGGRGSPAAPRCTIPNSLPAGALVKVAGGPYTYTIGGQIPLGGTGTATQPIFISGIGKPEFRPEVDIFGSYVIVENIDVNCPDGISINAPAHHILFRHSEKRGGVGGPKSAISIGYGSGIAHNITLYNISSHDNGDWQATFDQDHQGMRVGPRSQYVWIVDSTVYHTSGDGISVYDDHDVPPHHVFLGRNLAYEIKQTGIWSKQASDVIISQNTIHSMAPSGSSGGSCLGFQYGPEKVWIIYNHLYNCNNGIGTGSDSGPSPNTVNPQNSYFIGNVIHDVTDEGIKLRDETTDKNMYNNLIYNAPAGIRYTDFGRNGALIAKNNIFANISGIHIFIEDDTAAGVSSMSHNLFDKPISVSFSGNTNIPCPNCIANQNPQFMNVGARDFHLQTNSPARNAGTSYESILSLYEQLYGASIRVDSDQVSRPQESVWDIGPYEFVAAQSCSVPGDCAQIECQTASCVGNQCVYANVANGLSCTNDNLFCNGVEQCQSGSCSHVNPQCTLPGQTCNEVNDQCVSDTTPPVISNVQAGSITASGATVSWTTNETSSSIVYYGTTISYGSSTNVGGNVLSHSVPLSSLSSGTLYHYKVSSTDAAGNNANSTDQTFTTSVPSAIIEAELMTLTRYASEPITGASNGAVASRQNSPGGAPPGIAATTFQLASGNYNINVTYCDENDGAASFTFKINGASVDTWIASQNLGSANCVSTTLTSRIVAQNRAMTNSDTISIEGTEQGSEFARVDKIEFIPTGAPVNQPPANVNAGVDQLLTQPTSSTLLSGSATDDGLPSGILRYNWTRVSGPTTVTFGNSSNGTTLVMGLTNIGTYVFRLTVNDTQLANFDDVNVTVQFAPVCGNGIVEGTEQCDGTNLSAQTCQSQGFTSGNLSCSSCAFNTTQCVAGAGATYYVDLLISPASCTTYNVVTRSCGSGTSTAYKTIAGASAVAQSGETISIRGGSYAEQLNPVRSGTAGNYITYQAYNRVSEQVDIAGGNPAMLLSNRQYLIIDGLRVADRTWVEADNTNFTILRNNIFLRTPAGGTTGNIRFIRGNYNVLFNNYIYDGNDNIVLIGSDHNLVLNNTIGQGRHSVWGIRCGDFNVIRGNYLNNTLQKLGEVYDCDSGNSGVQNQLNSTKHNVIEQNIFALTGTGGDHDDNNGIQYGGQEGIIRRNVFYANWLGIGMQVYDGSGFGESDYNEHNLVYHNVFYQNNMGVDAAPGGVGNVVKNNIIYANTLNLDRQAGATFTNNHVGGADPLFVSPNAPTRDFHLQSSSADINAGAFLTTTVGSGSGTTMQVANARYFYDGFGIAGEVGDVIQLQGQTQTARITAINYATNSLTLSSSLTWGSGAGIALAYSGSAPDNGAYEFSGAPANQAPNGIINSPTGNVVITIGQSVNFQATASDPDNNLPLTFLWNFGGGAMNSNSEDPGNVQFNSVGVYTVTFTVTDSLGLPDPTPASVQVTVQATNTAPSVNAGNNQTITLPASSTTLFGNASDDGLPSGILRANWSLTSGQAGITFGNASNLTTTVNGLSATGTYSFMLNVSDTVLSATAIVTITVNPAPPCILTNSYWTPTTATQGQAVILTINGTNCNGQQINFSVYDDDVFSDTLASVQPAIATMNTVGAAATWQAENGDTFGNSEYYFIAKLVSNFSNNRTSGQLIVTPSAAPAVTIVSPVSASTVGTQNVNVDFSLQNWQVLGTNENHIHFYLDSDPTPYMFYNGGTNTVQYNGGATAAATRIDSDTIRFNNLGQGSHTVRAILADEFHTELTSAQHTVTFSVDTIAPNLLNIQVNNVGTTTATINWTTNELANATVEYGPIVPYNSNVGRSSLATTHGFTLSGLISNTLYHYRVRSSDSVGNTNTSTDRTFTTLNIPPTANAGPDQSLTDNDGNGNEQVTLNGAGSGDADGTIVNYTWREGLTQIASGIISTIPLNVGVHTINLTVTDNAGATANDTVVVTIQAQGSPIAPTNLRTLQSGLFGINLTWQDNSNNENSFILERSTSPVFSTVTSFTRPASSLSYNDTGLAPGTTYYYRVKAQNGAGNSSYSNVASNTTVANQAPDGTITSPTGNVIISVAGSVNFAGSGTDPEGHTPLTYRWQFGDGRTSTVQNPGAIIYSVAGIYGVTFTVNDSLGMLDPTPATRTVTVNAAPGITIAPVSAITLPTNTVFLDATVSDDGFPSGILLYNWTKVSGAGSVNFANGNAVDTSATFSTNGTYVLRLTVNDTHLSNSSTVQVVVNPAPPVPYVLIDSPVNNSVVSTRNPSIDFTIGNFNIGDIGQTHIHFYLDSDPVAYMFYNGATNRVDYNFAPATNATRMDADTITFLDLLEGNHTVRAILAQASHVELANVEARASVLFTIELCGNSLVDSADEVCDGLNLSQQTCLTQGFASGTLACTSSCVFNTTQCVAPTCGDNSCNGGETCSSCPSDCTTGCGGTDGGSSGSSGGSSGSGGSSSGSSGGSSGNNPINVTPIGGPGCDEVWNCGDWSACVGGERVRLCNDLHSCGTALEKPIDREACLEGGNEPNLGSTRYDLIFAGIISIVGLLGALAFVFYWHLLQVKVGTPTYAATDIVPHG